MRIAITGGTGFIGGHLADSFIRDQVEVILISRSNKQETGRPVTRVSWDQLDRSAELLEGVDAIIHLAGESINQRWSTEAKKRILNSRIDTTTRIVQLVDRLQQKPQVVVSGSGISIYGTSESEVFDESSSARIEDFLSSVVERWEKASDQMEATRVIKLRTGIVFGMDGGALPKMILPYKLGIGGRVGNGKQWLSWIHIEDMIRLIRYCIENSEVKGPVNATAPHPVTNDEFGRTVGRVLHRPHLLPVPSFVFKVMFGELSDLLLKGQKVLPAKIMGHGFTYKYPNLESALRDLLRRN
jgi:uncharacterized protein (TIGR01777 family)